MPRVIMVTDLTLWSMGKGHGGPAFTQTVKKYIDEKWEVFLVSDEPSNREYPELDAEHNLVLKPSVFKKYGGLRKIGVIFRWLDHMVMTGRFVRECDRLLRAERENTVLYAYEVFGVEACRRLAKKYGCPVVTRFQGTILSQFPNNLINWILRHPHHQALAQPADLVIMTDDGTLGDQVLKELNNNSPTMFVRNGLELMDLDIDAMYKGFSAGDFRKALGVLDDEIMFLTVSRLVGWKKVERAIDGFSELCKKGIAGKLVIVGDGDSRTSLENRAQALGISERVVFTGSVPHDKVYEYMMACDVFVSLYDLSNVGNPLLEAMTLGKCIVTLDVGATRFLIHNRENGILLNVEELPQLGDIMGELAESEDLRKSLGTAAANYAKENFYTWKTRMDMELSAVSALLRKP